MRYKYYKKIIKFVITRFVFFLQAQNAPKPVFWRGSAPDSAGELTTLPGSSLVGYLDAFDKFGVSNLAPTAPRFSCLSTQIPGYASDTATRGKIY